MILVCLVVTFALVVAIQEISVRRNAVAEPVVLKEMLGRGAPLYYPREEPGR